MRKNLVRMSDILNVSYPSYRPDKAQQKAVMNILKVTSELYLRVDRIKILPGRVLAICPSGDYIEYAYDRDTGELKTLDEAIV